MILPYVVLVTQLQSRMNRAGSALLPIQIPLWNAEFFLKRGANSNASLEKRRRCDFTGGLIVKEHTTAVLFCPLPIKDI